MHKFFKGLLLFTVIFVGTASLVHFLMKLSVKEKLDSDVISKEDAEPVKRHYTKLNLSNY